MKKRTKQERRGAPPKTWSYGKERLKYDDRSEPMSNFRAMLAELRFHIEDFNFDEDGEAPQTVSGTAKFRRRGHPTIRLPINYKPQGHIHHEPGREGGVRAHYSEPGHVTDLPHSNAPRTRSPTRKLEPVREKAKKKTEKSGARKSAY